MSAVGGGEIKSVLTLDASGFEASMKTIVGSVDAFDGRLKAAGESTSLFEKKVSTLGSDIGDVSGQFKALEQTITALAAKLELAGTSGFGSIASGASKAKSDIAGLTSTVVGVKDSMAEMTKWIKNYGGSLESLNPLISGVTKSQKSLAESNKLVASSVTDWVKGYSGSLKSLRAVVGEVTADQKKLAESGEALAVSTVNSMNKTTKAKVAALEEEKLTNAEMITSRKAMIAELQLIDKQMGIGSAFANKKGTTVSSVDPKTGETSEYQIYKPGGRNLNTKDSRQDKAIYDAQGNEAQATIGHIQAIVKELEVKNTEITKSITLIGEESLAAVTAAEKEKAATLAATQAIKDKNAAHLASAKSAKDAMSDSTQQYSAATKAAAASAAERKQIATDIANHEREQARQITQMWKGMGQLWGASKIEKGLSGSVDQASNMQQTNIGVQALNYDGAHNRAIDDSAAQMSKNLGFISKLDAVKSRMSAIASIGQDNATIIDATLEKAVKASNNLQNLGYAHGDMQTTIRNLYGVVEMRQQTNNADQSNATFEMMQKIITGTGGKVQTQDMETVLRRIGQGAGQLSDHGMYNLAAIVDQFKVAGGDGGSGGGVSTVGTAFKMFQAYAMGKGKSAAAVKEFAGAGILDTGSLDLSQDKAGVLKDAKTSGFKNQDLWMKDPVAAIQAIWPQILAFTQKKENVGKFYQGADINDSNAQLAAVSQYLARLGITQTAITAVMTAADPRSKERIGHQVDTMQSSKGIEEVSASERETYKGKTQDAKAALDNMSVTVGNVLLPALSSVMGAVAGITRSLSEFAEEHSAALKFGILAAGAASATLAFKGMSAMFGMVGINFKTIATEVAASFGITSAAAKEQEVQNLRTLAATALKTDADVADTAATMLKAKAQQAAAAITAELAIAQSAAAKTAAEEAIAEEAAAVAAVLKAKAAQTAAVGTTQLAIADTELLAAESRASLAVDASAVAMVIKTDAERVASVSTTQLAAADLGLTAAEINATLAAEAQTIAVRELSVAEGLAAGAATLLEGAIGLIFSPLVLITGAIGIAALAWDKFGDKAEENAKRAEGAANRAARALSGLGNEKDKVKNEEDMTAAKSNLQQAKYSKANIAPTELNAKLIEAIDASIKSDSSRIEVLTAEREAIDDGIAAKKKLDAENAAELVLRKNFVGPTRSGLPFSDKERMEQGIVDGASRAEAEKLKNGKKPKSGDTTAADKAAVDSTDGPGKKHVRGFEDLFAKAFENITTRATEAGLKIKALIDGEGTYQEQGMRSITGKLWGGQFDKNGDAKNRSFLNEGFVFDSEDAVYRKKSKKKGVKGEVATQEEATDLTSKFLGGRKLAGPGEAGYNKKEYAQGHSVTDAGTEDAKARSDEAQLRALNFAKGKAISLSTEAEEAQANETEGLNLQTKALAALNREFGRLEAENPATANSAAYAAEKSKAISAQVSSDLTKFNIDTKSSTGDINSKLTTGSDGKMFEDAARLANEFENSNTKFANSFLTLMNESDAEIKRVGAGSKEGIQLLKDQEHAQDVYTQHVIANSKQQEEAMLSPVQKLAKEWGKTSTLMNSAEVGWANGFVSNLETTLDKGSASWRDYGASILKDIRKIYMQEQIGKPLASAMDNIGDSASKILFNKDGKGNPLTSESASSAMWGNLKSVVSDAATSVKGFWNSLTGATPAISDLATGTAKAVAGDALELTGEAKAIAAQTASTLSLNNLAAAASAASVSMGGSAGGGVGGILGGLLGGASGSPGTTLGSNAVPMAGDIMPAVMGATGGINAFGSLTPLAKYNGPPMKAYARGGIANSPQLALFGEAGPEAYVPLPDGRTIPVTMTGGGGQGGSGGNTVTIQINVASGTGTDSSKTSGKDDAGMWTQMAGKIKAVVREELITNQRPGGLLYK